ncbi:MAG: hypothetical protein QRY71_00540 [Candidatus Rhabdochlamydia sp.]
MKITDQNFCCSYLLKNQNLNKPNANSHPIEKIPENILPSDEVIDINSLQTMSIKDQEKQKICLQLDPKVTLIEKNLLKPLQDNPLKKIDSLDFEQWKIKYEKYCNLYPEWCKFVQSGNFLIREAPSYQQKIEACKKKMSLIHEEDRLDNLENTHLENIDQAIHLILEEYEKGDKKSSNSKMLNHSIQIIYEKIYLLITRPIGEILAYKNNPLNLFIMNQKQFSQELHQLANSFLNAPPQILIDELLFSIKDNALTKQRDLCVKAYPLYQTEIDWLVNKAKLLIQEAKAKVDQEILNYYNEPPVHFCLSEIFSKRQDLKNRYDQVFQGNYFSAGEMPRGYSNGTIHYASYLSQLTALLKSCTKFNEALDKEPTAFQTFQKECEEYLKYKERIVHFQKNIQPLILLLQPLKNIMLWPRQYELSEKEMKLIKDNLYLLMEISNQKSSKQSLIAHEFLDISEIARLETAQIIQKENCSALEKHQAYRALLHGNIPWRALQMIGNLLHHGGDISKEAIEFNQALVEDALIDLMEEIPKVIQSIEKLIDFEVEEFSPSPSLVSIEKLPPGSYANICLLGDFTHTQKHLQKIEEILTPWKDLSLTASSFKEAKIKHAILRTIESLGEVVKNLRSIGLLSKDPIWKYLEELRDLLSHSERSSIEQQIHLFIHGSKDQTVTSLLNDFRKLLEHFSHYKKTPKAVQTWADRKKEYHATQSSRSYLEVGGINNLYVFLTEKISAGRISKLQKSHNKQEEE